MKFVLVALLFTAPPISTGKADGDATRGKSYYSICRSCHGRNAEGNPAIGTPRLSGLQDWYLTKQLINFRTGVRGSRPDDFYGRQMVEMVAILPNTQAVADVVAYITTLKGGSYAEPGSGDGDADRGRELYTACIQCHGSKAQGLKASGSSLATYNLDCPRLAGQNPVYLIRQLRNYESGIRGYHEEDKEGQEMRGRTKNLSNHQKIKDVVAYISTLK